MTFAIIVSALYQAAIARVSILTLLFGLMGMGTAVFPGSTLLASDSPWFGSPKDSKQTTAPRVAPPQKQTKPAAFTPSAAELAGAASCEAFGFDFYQQLVSNTDSAASTDKNIALSPFSLASVLEMLRLGTVNTAHEQLTTALHTGSDSALSLPSSTELASGGATLTTADSLWIDHSFPPKRTYLAAVKAEFGNTVFNVDFDKPTAAAAAINLWVSNNTAKRITNIVNASDVASAFMVVANAVYFKGTWASKFQSGATQNGPFHLASGAEISVPMMRQTSGYRFGIVDGVKILELPYSGNDVSMVLLMPATGQSTGGPISLTPGQTVSLNPGQTTISSGTLTITQVEALVQQEWFENALTTLQPQTVAVSIPRFTFDCQPDAVSVLEGLGVTQIFTPSGDFYPVSNQALCVTALKHRAWLAVDESGTEAAATTVSVISVTCVTTPPDFTADQPFLFVIRHNPTGAPLFIGRVSNPLSH